MANDGDLITTIDLEDVAQLLQEDPVLKQEVRNNLGPEAEACLQEIEMHLPVHEEAGFRAPPPDVDKTLPEIVLLHGITDSHLADVSGRRPDRIWFSMRELMFGRFTRSLPLQEDGFSDLPGFEFQPDGHKKKKYDPALKNWRNNGFATHVFCYDWRRSVQDCADNLHTFLNTLETQNENGRIMLVCHSMGGLVASAYAASYPEWKEKIASCVFVGSPLGGSFSVAQAILGKSPAFAKMDKFSLTENMLHFQEMAATFRGLIDMLPNPDVINGVTDLYTQDGWPGEVKPKQEWLDQSRVLKETLWNSPLHARSTHLVAQKVETVADMPWNATGTDRNASVVSMEGDGAVLTKSSLAPGITASYLLSQGTHGMLCTELEVIEAVKRIGRGEDPELSPISVADITGETQNTDQGAAFVADTHIPDDVTMEIGKHFMSDDAIALLLDEHPDTHGLSFDRKALKQAEFSWQNALSMALASRLAYGDEDKQISTGKNGWGFDELISFDHKDSQGFVAWDDQVVVLSFRGTEQNLKDWMRNLKIADKNWPPYGEVHSGFLKGYYVVENEIKDALEAADACNKRLWITGHSLGGALATIAGAALYTEYKPTGIFTYGQPKLAKAELKALYQKEGAPRFYRFVNHQDVVTRIPPFYKHVGVKYCFDGDGNYVDPAAGFADPALLQEENELSEVQFEEMQERLDQELENPPAPGAFVDPNAALFGLSVGDHSIQKQYIPIIAKIVSQQL